MAKLIKKIVFTGKIVLKTGLHIGGSNTALNIGGPDNYVVRNPLEQPALYPRQLIERQATLTLRTI